MSPRKKFLGFFSISRLYPPRTSATLIKDLFKIREECEQNMNN